MYCIDMKIVQKDKFGVGKNGFICGNFQIGMFVIDLDDDYFDMLQEEFCSVVEVFGVSLEKGWYDQLFIVFCVLLLSCKNLFGDIKLDGMV